MLGTKSKKWQIMSLNIQIVTTERSGCCNGLNPKINCVLVIRRKCMLNTECLQHNVQYTNQTNAVSVVSLKCIIKAIRNHILCKRKIEK